MTSEAAIGYYIGCAGWSLPTSLQADFPGSGTHLARYAQRFSAVEINSSFYRPHRPDTYRRWADSVPEDFRFAVKIPRAITHQARLRDSAELVGDFLFQAHHLQQKLGCLLLQLPPSLQFDVQLANDFFSTLQTATPVPVACEARHPSWFGAEAAALFTAYQIARVEADPALSPPDATPVASTLWYLRLHGAPVIYRSQYSDAYLDQLAARIADQQLLQAKTVWCVFDNTANGAAVPNALGLIERLRAGA